MKTVDVNDESLPPSQTKDDDVLTPNTVGSTLPTSQDVPSKSKVDTSIITSPIRDALNRVPPRSKEDFYLKEYQGVDAKIGKQCVFVEYSTAGAYSCQISEDTALELLSGSVSELGALYGVRWNTHGVKKQTKTRSARLRKLLRNVQPTPIDLRFDKSRVRAIHATFDNPDGAEGVKRRRKQLKLGHDYVAWMDGWCTCRDDHDCKATFVCGFTKGALHDLFDMNRKKSVVGSTDPENLSIAPTTYAHTLLASSPHNVLPLLPFTTLLSGGDILNDGTLLEASCMCSSLLYNNIIIKWIRFTNINK